MESYFVDISLFNTDIKRCLLLNSLAQKAGCNIFIMPDDEATIAKMGARMRQGIIDYYGSKGLKVNLSGDTFDPRLFDRDFGGPGTALKIVTSLLEFLPNV
jgi:hypothetical protein